MISITFLEFGKMFRHLFRKNHRFRSVPESEDCETLISEGKYAENKQLQMSSKQSMPDIYILLLCCLLMVIAFAAGVWIGASHPMSLNRQCTEYISQYSPLLEDVDISYDFVRYEGSLMNENIFRQVGSPTVDAAWESLGIEYRHIVVPSNLAQNSGLQPSQVQISEKYGGGFPANVEGLHHLHCLNLVRKSLYYNFEYYHSLGEGEFSDDEHMIHFHVSHCLDIIRQQLMCNVDIAVLGQVWYNKESPTALPDFNTDHKCRNYDAVRKWAEDHQAPEYEPPDYLMPPRSRDDVLDGMP